MTLAREAQPQAADDRDLGFSYQVAIRHDTILFPVKLVGSVLVPIPSVENTRTSFV